MIHSIIERVLNDIRALNFADRVAGIVTVGSKKNMVEGGTSLKKFPIYPNRPTECVAGDYFDCIPDDKFRSIIYFEEISNTVIAQDNYTYQMSADVRLVGWFNLKKIGQYSTDLLMRLILQSIPEITDFDDIFSIKMNLTGVEVKSPNIFGNYTYDEAETQYLLFPYDYGSMRFTATYRMNKCVDDIELNPNCGKK